MGIFDNILRIFTGGSEATQQSQQTSRPVDLTPAEYSGIRPDLVAGIRSLISSGGGPQYGGPLFSPETANEQAVRGQLMDTTGPGTARAGYTSDVITGKYLPGQEGANPFFDAAVRAAQRPTLEGLTETLTRALPGRFTQAGQFVQPGGSSAFDRAAAIATRGAANAIGDIATNMGLGAYEGERGRQQQAVQLEQAEVDTTIKNLQAQALPRLIQELGIERGLQLFQTRTTQLLQALQLAAGIGQPVTGQVSQGTSGGRSVQSRGLFPGGLSLPQ